MPDCGSSYVLPRMIGMSRALELSLLAEKLPAETALDWGLINRVVDDAELMARSHRQWPAASPTAPARSG